MQLILRMIVLAALGFAAGTTLTPIWREGGPILIPFVLVSLGILIAAIGYTIGNLRRGR